MNRHLNYSLVDRILYLMSREYVIMNDYLARFEISRAAFFRDIRYIRDFYNVEYIYNPNKKVYEKKEGEIKIWRVIKL